MKHIIKKQYFLELISKKTEDRDTNKVLELLNGLEEELESELFDELCELLTLKSIKEKEEYKNWSVLKGREKCFEQIIPLVKQKFFDGELEFKRDFDYFKCFKGLLLSQKFDFLDKNKLRNLQNFEIDRGIETEFVKIGEREDGFGDLRNSKIEDILDETLQENYSYISKSADHNSEKNFSLKNSQMTRKNISYIQTERGQKITDTLKEIQESNDLRPTQRSPAKFSASYGTDGSYIENLDEVEENVEEDGNEIQKSSSHIRIYGYREQESGIKSYASEEKNKVYEDLDKEEEISRLIPSKMLSQKVDYMSSSQISQKTLEQIKHEFQGKENNFIDNVSKGLEEVSKVDFNKIALNNIYSSYQSNYISKNGNKTIYSPNDGFKVIYEGSDTLPIRAAAFSPDGQYISIGSNSKVLNVYSIQNILFNYVIFVFKINFKNEKIRPPGRTNLLVSMLDLHQGPIYSIDYSIKKRDIIASGSMDKSVKLVLMESEGENSLKFQEKIFIGNHKGMVRSVKFNGDSTQLLSAGQDINLKLWDVETQELIQKFKTSCNHTYCARFTYDNNTIIGVGADKYIQLWDKRSGKTSHLAHIGSLSKMNYLSLEHNEFSDSFFNISNYNPKSTWEGHKMAIGHQSGEVSIWDLRNLDTCESTLQLHQEDCRSVEYDPSCRYLATSSFDCTIKIFDIEEGKFCHTFGEHEDRAVMVKWHPFLPLLVSTSADCTFKVYATDSFLNQCDF